MKPIFTIPDYNGLLKTKIVSTITKKNIIIIQTIVKQIVNGNFYKTKEFPNLSFIELYYEEINSGPEAQKFAMLSAIKERLLNFHASDLIGVSDEDLNRYCSSKNC